MTIAKSILNKGSLELVRDIQLLRKDLARLESKHKLASDKILSLVKPEVLIPVSIFRQEMTVLEASVKYMKENLGYNFHEIGVLLNRNEKNIWHAYDKARKKYSKKMVIKETKYFVPTSVFADRNLSPLEAAAFYLKEAYELSFHEVAVMLHRDDRTIWTVVKKAEKKGAKVSKKMDVNTRLAKDIESFKARIKQLESKYKLDFKQVIKLIKELIVPSTIFKSELTAFEAIIKYMRENLGLSLSEIARILDRDQRNIWHAYDKAKKKFPSKFIVKETKYYVPISILTSKESPLESIAKYLRTTYKLSFHEIALILKKDDRTIWTVINKR